ncbi:MAG: hypothetical protein IKV43_05620 [Clostridia bacterium]|nr:hypothetical protein [Clostridia bacterium]
MTEAVCTRKKETRMCGGVVCRAVSTLWLFGVLGFSLFFSGEVAGYAIEGMALAVFSVLPTAIPSMLICDLYRSFGHPENLSILGRIFRGMYGVPPSGLRAYILGNLFGFPMGAREVGIAYRDGQLSREDAERLLPLATNPSPAFVVGAVGGAMMGDLGRGILLLACVWISSVAGGLILRKSTAKSQGFSVVSRQNYNIVESIKGIGGASLTIISFISAFSVLLGICEKYIVFAPAKYAVFAVLEVAGGVSFFLKNEAFLDGFFGSFSGVFVAFSLGFGGVSVMLQSAAFVSEYGLRLRGYLRTKLMQGVLSALLFWVMDLWIF